MPKTSIKVTPLRRPATINKIGALLRTFENLRNKNFSKHIRSLKSKGFALEALILTITQIDEALNILLISYEILFDIHLIKARLKYPYFNKSLKSEFIYEDKQLNDMTLGQKIKYLAKYSQNRLLLIKLNNLNKIRIKIIHKIFEKENRSFLKLPPSKSVLSKLETYAKDTEKILNIIIDEYDKILRGLVEAEKKYLTRPRRVS